MKATAIVGLALFLVACTNTSVISEGSRVGMVAKFSHKALCNSNHWGWEGELSMTSGTTAAGQGTTADGAHMQVGAWAFSIPEGPDSKPMIDAINASMGNGHHVKVVYRQVREHDSCQSDTDYLAVAVQDLEAK